MRVGRVRADAQSRGFFTVTRGRVAGRGRTFAGSNSRAKVTGRFLSANKANAVFACRRDGRVMARW
jgi:hypothetical protein